VKAVVFLGDSLSRVRDFPETARATAGFQLHQLQLGLDPDDWKPMTSM
jgi:phage-related protein